MQCIRMHTSFLQSQGWEEFQKSVGYQTFRVDSALLIKKSLFFGKSYFYAPRAGTSNGERVTGNFIDDIIQLAKKENCIFLRIEPQNQLSIKNYELRKVADVQPSQTIILDLTKSEEELLAGMHPKTRYNIRLAEKKAVTVRTVETRHGASEDFEKFWELMEETVGRDKFRSHGKEYYKTMLGSLDISIPTAPASSPPRRPAGSKEGNDGNKLSVRLYFAEYENKILAAGIFAFYGDVVTYLHGASTHKHKEIMAPYALHWKMIKLAKQLGYKHYDFYGINEKKWPGVTRFKRGFGGKEVNYPGCFDIIFDKEWYGAYKVLRRIKSII
ncbi:hypothetical protein COU01_02485 [Candidatus Falkowbacteria bacterium CG10_big_fil_rev_8_21_14_0_10_44_15]|uniref:Methicillin resistance protein n=1 Tax=Candidatus Falkowbacteria bacterium CG10_big_fil_rev_8_21_14_0_10_44_15 TaxID=1974569 RepID=A0A2H0UZN0_9BACT|nr:MAG: hypothetical protein COU01_02485 [Candidatus Falkowbacteria bacterium CG10_big_fil_rev_8_21_14_0_10_44_15]